MNGPGTLNLTGSNSFTGAVAINTGTLTIGAASNFGASTNSVALGTPNAGTGTTPTAALSIAASTTIGSFTTATNNAAVNTLSIPTGATLNVNSNLDGSGTNAVFAVGSLVPASPAPLNTVTTNLTISGGGSLSVTGGAHNSSFLSGMSDTNNTAQLTNTNITTNLDMSGLSNFTFVTGTGPTPTGNPPSPAGNEFLVGVGIAANGTTTLAANNSITAGTIDVGDTGPTPGATIALVPGQAGSGTVTLDLGSGTNVLNANSILIARGREVGSIAWASATTTGTLTVNGAAGAGSTADITIGFANSGTPPSIPTNVNSFALNLAGHSVNINAGTLLLGQLVSGAGAGKATTTTGGTTIFDTGTFNVANVLMCVTAGDNTVSLDGVGGTLQVGSSANSSGILNVGTSFVIGDDTGGTAAGAKGTLTIKGGTANVNADIIDKSTAGTSTTTLTLSGGTLNMMGHAIGTTAAGTGGTRHLSTVTLPTLGSSATLANLGGDGINGAGLTMNGTGVLILEGNNNFTSSTTVSAGTLQVGQSGDATPPTQALQAAVRVAAAGNLAFGSSQSFTNSSTITGAGGITQNGTGTTTLTGNNSNTGPTTLVAGALNVNTLPNGSTNGPIGASSNSAGNVVFSGGALRYSGAGTTTDRLFSIAATGGSLDASGSGALVMGNTGANVSADPAPRAATDGTNTKITLANVNDLVVGMTVSGTNIAAGTTITVISKIASTITLSAAPDCRRRRYAQLRHRARTFTLTGTGTANNTLAGTLSDSAGGGALSLAKSGAGKWLLTATNTYSGGTTVSGGTLVPSLNALGSGGLAISGSTSTVAIPAGQATALRLPSLSISNGKLDLADNDLILDYTGTSPLATIAGYLQNGFASGAWNGAGIDSSVAAGNSAMSTALGYADVSNTTFDGQAIPGNAIVVKYTYYGDNNLDGQVTTADFQMFLDGLATGGTTWSAGDYTYDGKIDLGNDFDLFLVGYLTNGGQLGDLAPIIESDASLSSVQRAQLLAAVPEPSAMALLAMGSVAAVRRRRR